MKYRKEIDGLRALAVLPVVLFHAGFSLFSGGFVGVDIFFVISGYLITTIILNEMDQGTFSLSNFYERRARRILPALFFMMLCTIPFAWFWMLPQDLKSFSQSLVAVPLFVSNILFWLTSDYFDTASELKPLLHTWSLAVEEQYYFLFPLFLMLTWKLGKKSITYLLLLLALISLLLAHSLYMSQPSFAFYLLPTRAFEILIGALASFYMRRDKINVSVSQQASSFLSTTGLVLLLYAIFLFDKNTPSPGIYTIIPVLGAVLILVFANSKNLVGQLLGNKVFVGIGLISYSSYLWHQPLLAFARLRSVDALGIFALISLCFFSLFLGYVSYRFIEGPFRDKNRVSLKIFVISASMLASVFVVLGMVGHFGKGFSERLDYAVSNISNIPKYHEFIREDDVCFNLTLNSKLLNCVKGDQRVKPTVMLLGDSHASSLTFELAKQFQYSNISFLNETKSGCLPILEIQQLPDIGCAEFVKLALEEARKRDIKTIIIAARWVYYLTDENFDNGEGGIESGRRATHSVVGIDKSEPISIRRNAILSKIESNISNLVSQGYNVVVVYPIPQNGWVPSDKLAKTLLFSSNYQDLSTSYHKFKADTEHVYETLDSLKSNNLQRVIPEYIFCNTAIRERCFSTISNQVFYYDDDHLSNDGASLVVEQIMKYVR